MSTNQRFFTVLVAALGAACAAENAAARPEPAGVGARGWPPLSDKGATADTDTSEPVAAINGGFFLRENGQTNAYAGCPRGLQIVAGEVLSAPSGNASMWVDYSGQPHAANVTSRFEIIP